MGDSDKVGMKLVAPKLKEEVGNIDLMIIGDTSNFDIVIAEKGVLWLKFKCYGKSAHGSRPWEGVNAIEKLGKFLMKLNDLKFSTEHELLGKSTISINKFNAGFKTNVIPGEAEAAVDLRLVPNEDKGKVLEMVNGLLEEANKEKDVKIEMQEEAYEPAVETSRDQEFIPVLMDSIKNVLGKESEIKAEHGATGSGNFIEQGIPTVVMGPGREDLAHVANEFIEIKDLEDAVKIYSDFIKKYLG
jgi:acetylornithine deacetylase/succinyl-diaminopimelate desuccinylase-like protein